MSLKMTNLPLNRRLDPESFLSGYNAPYILDLFYQYRMSPSNVSVEWQKFFEMVALHDHEVGLLDDRAPEWPQKTPSSKSSSKGSSFSSAHSVPNSSLRDSLRALMMIRAFRVRGHLLANLDPLGLAKPGDNAELLPQTYGFTEESLKNEVHVDGVMGFEKATVQQLYDHVRKIYCQTVGIEFMHIQDPHKKSWIQERVENTPPPQRVTKDDKKEILEILIKAEGFERFLDVKYPGTKRFGLEGGESIIVALESLVHRLSSQGVKKIVFGTAHRGRLNILANVIDKPIEKILAHFKGADLDPNSFHGSGDVKYHLGYSSTRSLKDNSISLTLMPNPSHLEAVDPVVIGKVRADQDMLGDTQRRQVVAVMLHGDAAFAGQGLVAETLDMSGLHGYKVGGAIHLIINNQIGFTTSPTASRSSPYTTDLAKGIQAPIFHVNGDDPETVMWVARLAADYQRQFAEDVVIDVVCYRRQGHNEIDEPSFTQPKMYQKISQHPSTGTLYKEKLVAQGLITPEQYQEKVRAYEKSLQEQLENLTETKVKDVLHTPQWLEGAWSGIKPKSEKLEEIFPSTGISKKVLQKISKCLTRVPENFHLNTRLVRVLRNKEQMITEDQLDWATGEALAIGSLLLENKTVRLSGQDVGRGTFSHRHGVWVDQETEKKYIPLNNLEDKQALFEIVDSPLSEVGVLGFEYGYSLANPQALVMWEAQFGDFANGAQVIIDQFISSGEYKWQRFSGLVMLLPHGYEGQGPEHSSARLERYLQLCGEDNLRVVNCSTPANYFHVLRRQIHALTRKPLIIMSPKTLLRHKLAVSSFSHMEEGTTFVPVFDEILLTPQLPVPFTDLGPTLSPGGIKRVILCSGKIYYELLHYRKEIKAYDTAIIRLEQYYPFPHIHLQAILAPYKHASFFWCQEEPMNMGAWSFLDRRLEEVLKEIGSKTRFGYVGRPEAASPATGNTYRHEAEQKYIWKQAFGE